jgi:hypothetical protein
MADTVSYRAAADTLRAGWPGITERGPGYPLLLIATGSSSGSTQLLFVVQLALHVLSVVLVVDLARRADVGPHGRAALAALLVAPVVLLRVLHEGTEGLAAALVTGVAWLALTPPPSSRRSATLRWTAALGLLCGTAALVRPNLAVLFVPIALVAGSSVGRSASARPSVTPARHRWRRSTIAGAIAVVALVPVLGYSALNGIRFDSFGLTPLTPYHLNAKTAPYVEELPARFEPARTVLIEERDAALLLGEELAPDNYIWRARPRLAEVTGLEGRALDRYVLELDLHLIATNPYGYLDTVKTASVNYSQMDSQPAVLGLGRPAAWAMQAVHLVLLVAFFAAAGLVPGLALARRVPAHQLRTWALAIATSATIWLSAVATETGTARLRAPSEPLLALALVLSASIARRAWRAARTA